MYSQYSNRQSAYSHGPLTGVLMCQRVIERRVVQCQAAEQGRVRHRRAVRHGARVGDLVLSDGVQAQPDRVCAALVAQPGSWPT